VVIQASNAAGETSHKSHVLLEASGSRVKKWTYVGLAERKSNCLSNFLNIGYPMYTGRYWTQSPMCSRWSKTIMLPLWWTACLPACLSSAKVNKELASRELSQISLRVWEKGMNWTLSIYGYWEHSAEKSIWETRVGRKAVMLKNLYPWPNLICVTKLRRTRSARIQQIGNSYKMLVRICGGRGHLGDQVLYRRITLKLIFKEQGVTMWTTLERLRVGFNGELLWTR